MFSSLASLLPSALHINYTNSDLPRQTINPEETNNEDDDSENAHGVRTIQPQTISDQDQQNLTKGKEKDVKSPSETFIFVRPPPSKTNHPLNLQVQLVPPNTKPPGGVTGNGGDAATPTSANSNFTTDGVPLARTSSSNSSASYISTSYGSSTTSFSSFSSTSGYRRTIIPLYNLQAHNVMTNVIVDAGTDAKIAKFQKRGIELIDLALLEPVEVWGEGGREKDARRESMKIVADEMGAIVVSSVVVNANGGRTGGTRVLPTFLQPGGSRPVTPSAASSATSLHSQIAMANSSGNYPTVQPPIQQHFSSQTMGAHQRYYSTPPHSNVAPAAAAPFSISHPKPNSNSSSNMTLMSPASPASTGSMSLPMMSAPDSPAAGIASSKRNLFNKLFNKKQSGSTLLSPSGPGSPGSSGQQYPQQHPLARSQSPPITMTGYNQQDLEVSPPPTFASFALSPAPMTSKIIDGGTGTAAGGAGMERSFGSRSNSMKKRSAPPPALVEPPFSSSASNFEFVSPGRGLGSISGLTSPIEQQTTPTQMSVARGGKMETIITVTSSAPSMVEVPSELERERNKGHGRNMSLTSITSPLKATLKSRLSAVVLMGGNEDGSQSNSQVHGTGSSVNDLPAPANKKRRDRDRDASPHPSLGSKGSTRLSTMSTNGSADSHGENEGGGFPGNGNWSFGTGGNNGGNGPTPQQVFTTQAQAQSEITMNLRQQQLQLRPPVLGVQPTFVSSNPSSSGSSNPYASDPLPLDALTTTTMENPEQVLQGQRALMYVWLVRRWMKRRLSGHSGLSGLGDSAVGFLGGVVGGFKGEKAKEKGKEKEKGKDKDKDKSRSNCGDSRDKPGMGFSHDGLGAMNAPLMYGGVEVRFEWKRAKAGKEKSGSGKRKTRSGRGRTGTIGGGAESDGEVEASIRDRTREIERGRERSKERDNREERGSIRVSGGGEGGGSMMMAKTKERLKSEDKKKYRLSAGSLSSVTVNSEMDGGELGMKKRSSNNQYDDGEDSDPEDSETPWVCTLKLRKGAAPGAGGGLSAGDARTQPPVLQTQVLRIKVGTLSPTPHHPKVVAMLKVPFPLPDVEVERMGVVRRQGINIGGGVPPQNPVANEDTPYNGLVLTAEEIKDMVCSTGLWLVVREGFGGVGRISRKGDGWRIRA